MPTVNPTRYDMSASSIAAFKACPVRFKLAYREGLRLDKDTESQRVGTNWHALHELYHAALARWEALRGIKVRTSGGPPPPAPTVQNEFALEEVIDHLNKTYAARPVYLTAEEWELEQQVLLTCFIGYLWYYQNDPIEVLASEVPFELPVAEPRTGMPLPIGEVRRVGKMDHIIRWQGMVGTLERKSTSRGIDPSSDYWDKAKKDTQVSMYALAFREIGSRPEGFGLGITIPAESVASFGSTLYDVWHRPTIKPKMLTQAETAKFLTDGDYYGQHFGVYEGAGTYLINGTPAQIEPGKKGFAIRETIPMFAARLLADIQERPDFYFQRREIARTDADLMHFRKELFAVYQSQRLYERHGTWYENESQCRATFPCPYIPICYGPGHEAISASGETPAGFKRIFVDLTVNGKEAD